MSTPSAFQFFENLVFAEQPELTTKKVVLKKDRNPEETFMGFRLWKDGTVYPSKALVDKLQLEYPNRLVQNTPVMKDGVEVKDAAGNVVTKQTFNFADVRYGLDIIDSANSAGLIPAGGPRFILVAVTPKTEPKVDLFASTVYNEDGTPKSSVMEQGAATYGKETLLPLMAEVGFLPNEEGYMDFQIGVDMNLATRLKGGAFPVMKKVKRGAKEGSASYELREGVDLFPVIIVKANEVSNVETAITEEHEEVFIPVEEVTSQVSGDTV